MTAAARLPARNEPANNQFERPMAMPDLVLDPIVINGQLTIIEVARERLPSLQGVVQGSCCGRTVGDLDSLQPHPFEERIRDRSGPLLPQLFAIICIQRLGFTLNVIELTDQAQRILCNLAFVGDV